MDNYKPGMTVRILTVNVAVPADEEEGRVADAISAILTGAMCDDNTIVMDWQYTTDAPINESPVVTLSDTPEEGEAFALLDPRSYNGPAYLSDKLYTQMDGCKCPVCGSNQIEGDEMNIDVGGGSQECSCSVCGSRWVDAYDLNGYCNLEPQLEPDTLVRVTARYDWPNGTIGEQRWITRQEWATEKNVLQYLSDILSKPVTLTNWWADPL